MNVTDSANLQTSALLRTITDMKRLGQRTIWLDCDVLQADGGTRCASGSTAAALFAVSADLGLRLDGPRPEL